jgi:signal transduction histidine kinase
MKSMPSPASLPPSLADASHHSLRNRLLAGTLLWIAAIILLVGWGLDTLIRQHVAAQFDIELTHHLDQLTAQFGVDATGQAQLALPLSDPRFTRPYSGLYWQVDAMTPPAAGVLRSRALWDQTLLVPEDAPLDGETHRHRIKGPEGRSLGVLERSLHLDDDEQEVHNKQSARRYRLIVAADEGPMNQALARFEQTLWLFLGLLALGLALATLLQVWLGLAPLKKLQSALESLRSGRSTLLSGDFPSEIRPLVHELNQTLTHNAAVVDNARHQAGNLAHALKTPLTVLANATAGRHDDYARLVDEQCRLARRQIDYHLMRASAAATAHRATDRCEVNEIISGLVRVMQRLHADRALEIVIQPAAEIHFRGAAQDLQEMLGCLLDNACKWAAGRVEISVLRIDDHVLIHVDDDGSGLDAARRADVIRRGVRADESGPAPGSGLGLAIVDDLARLYEGRLELGDSPLGGLRAQLTLPAVK